MSLINDALKRASQLKPIPPPVAEPEAPLRPVEYRRPSRWPLILLPVLALALGTAAWFFLRGWQAQRGMGLPETKMPVVARELPAEPTTQQSANTLSEGQT